jgi:hypothetical protein
MNKCILKICCLIVVSFFIIGVSAEDSDDNAYASDHIDSVLEPTGSSVLIPVENVTPDPTPPGPTPDPVPNGTHITPNNGGNSPSQANGYSTGVPLLALFGVLSVAGLTFYRKR